MEQVQDEFRPGREYKSVDGGDDASGVTLDQIETKVSEILEPQAKAIADLGKQIKGIGELKGRLEKIETHIKRAPNPNEHKSREDIESERKELWTKAFNAFARRADHNETLTKFLARNEEFKALSVNSDPDGGYLVQPTRSNRIEAVNPATDDFRRFARVETISTDAFEEPYDTSRPTVAWVSEIGTRTTSTTPQIGLNRIPTHEIYARPQVTQKLLDDAQFDVEGWVSRKIDTEFRVSEGSAFVSGDGNGKPFGFLSYPFGTAVDGTARGYGTLQYIPTGNAAAFGTGINGVDVFDDTIAQMKTEYRPGCAWYMNRTTFATVSKLKDTTGASIVVNKLSDAVPATIRGYPVEILENMPSIGTNTDSIAFANFGRGYVVVDRMGVRTLRDPYTSVPYVTFNVTKRVGGGVVNSEAIKTIRFGT